MLPCIEWLGNPVVPLSTIPEGDENYPPLSALNDLLFCPRRCYLHRVEGIWNENAHTLTGSLDHRRVHSASDLDQSGIRTVRGLRLVSHSLRVQGVADLIEYHNGQPFPVEYKRGKRRRWDNDDVQLCAQAICLEEMLGVPVIAGAIYHTRSKRRREVSFDAALRATTEDAARQLHALLLQRTSPSAVMHKKCKQCSLNSICLPEITASQGNYSTTARDLFTHPND